MVLNMWGYAGVCGNWTMGSCRRGEQQTLAHLYPGVGGPSCGRLPRGKLQPAVSAGATNASDLIAYFSGVAPRRAPARSAEVTAPGVNIRSSMNDAATMCGIAPPCQRTPGRHGSFGPVGRSTAGYQHGRIDHRRVGAVHRGFELRRDGLPRRRQQCLWLGSHRRLRGGGLALGVVDALPGGREPKGCTLAPGEGVAVDVTFDSTGWPRGV